MSDEPDQVEPEGATRRPRGRSARARAHLEEQGGTAEAYVMYFKERVYATFTGLAIVLVVAANGHADPEHALFALVLGVLGITAAGFVSDVISHLAVHQTFPVGSDLRVLLSVAGGALSTVITPGILILLAWLDVIPLDAALRASWIIYVVTLGVIGWAAVRRSRLTGPQRLLVLGLLIALGFAVVGLQTLAHSI
ncbi:hypothetical protein IF188_15135 [Microbacterium sp. NEAU-LLC]|uniref:Yip1 domain-containing protein n=1 Tax=Microbacterium helvum TaxID=2773713 RepID=A0ABR8NRA1_9MICO|nr:hypothetical protein [Microbacterium helvum]MBD3943028.1 hypothetical protein [Microbacterium helvum]